MSDRRPEKVLLIAVEECRDCGGNGCSWCADTGRIRESKPSPADLLAAVRRGVESGTIKGEVVERMCVEHRSWLRDGDPSSVCAIYSWVRQYQGTPTRCKIVETLVIPVDGGEG